MLLLIVGRTGGNLICADAYRHAIWNGLMTITLGLGESGAVLYGEAHECGGSDNDNIMDRRNNLAGIAMALDEDRPRGTLIEFSEILCEKLEAGELWILSNTNDNTSDIVPSDGCECNN